jgi:hypothetical protein
MNSRQFGHVEVNFTQSRFGRRTFIPINPLLRGWFRCLRAFVQAYELLSMHSKDDQLCSFTANEE